MRSSLAAALGAALACWEASAASSPIIGIFTLPTEAYDADFPGFKHQCANLTHCEVVPASYVKFIEAAGGRVVLVSSRTGAQEAEHLARSLNGILFTGGPDYPLPPAAALMMEYSKQQHAAGTPGKSLPVWGTCLGFEWILNHTAPGALQMDAYDAVDTTMPLQLTAEAAESRLLGRAPWYVKAALMRRNVTYNYHRNGVDPSYWPQRPELFETFKVISTNVDSKGRPFVSTVEGQQGLPWFGVQWHPEKNAFEHGLLENGLPAQNIPHDIEAVAVEQYVGNFFISEARRNTNSFADPAEEAARMIYGHPTSTALAPWYVEVYYVNYPETGPALRSPTSFAAAGDEHLMV